MQLEEFSKLHIYLIIILRKYNQRKQLYQIDEFTFVSN